MDGERLGVTPGGVGRAGMEWARLRARHLEIEGDEWISKVACDYRSLRIETREQFIKEILTVNGVRFVLEDGSWGLIRASSNKPSLVVVTESTSSNDGKKKIFNFIDKLLQGTGKIGEYDQKI